MSAQDGTGRRRTFSWGDNFGPQEENPVVQYEIQEPVERMVAAQKALDERARSFLERFAGDEMFDGILDVSEEWRCWLEADKKNSCLFFDDTLVVFENKAYDYFVDHYSAEWKNIAKELAEIEKMGRSLDEYRIFMTSLYNVFNNRNRLPDWEYFNQVYSRANDYGMVLDRTSKNSFDLTVHFRPLDEVNRGNPYYRYILHMEHNPEHRKDGFVYSVTMMDAQRADSLYSGPVDLPVLGVYSKFEERVNDYFLNAEPSLFHFDAVRAKRAEEKAKYNIPAYYFEASFIDVEKLNSFSKKSYQYGHTSVFIPKSQVAIGGDKLYVNRWLYYKLKDEIERVESRVQPQHEKNVQPHTHELPKVDDVIAGAELRSNSAQGQGTSTKGQGVASRERDDFDGG